MRGHFFNAIDILHAIQNKEDDLVYKIIANPNFEINKPDEHERTALLMAVMAPSASKQLYSEFKPASTF